jgi:hypothetical protein
MTIIRNPIRASTRGPLRGPLQSAFGESVSLSITAPGAYFYLTSASPYDIGSTLQVADVDDAGGDYTVAISLTGGGTLTLSGTTGLTGSGDGTSSLSYSGGLSAWNTALNGADIAGLSDETATMSITMTRDADSLEVSRNVTVNAYPALAITTLAPADDATGVAYNRATYTATFNRNIQAGTGNVVLKLVGGAALETFDIAAGTGDQGGTVTISGADLVITPGVALTDNTAHAIQIAATAIDGADIGTGDSFAGIADDTTWSFTCENTTPTLSAPLDSQTGGTTATAAVTTDRGDGTLWWVVTTSATTPSHAQIKAGQDHTGSAAAADGSQAVTATGSQGVSITGLTAETQYYTHFTQESANDAAATPVSADGFLTPDITEPVLNSSVPADNATGVAVDSTIVLTFDENVILTTGGGNITLRKLDGSWTVVETFSRTGDTTGTGDNGGSISISGAVVTITPGADMAEETTHALRIAADCLENEAGHAYAGITDDTTLNWQTAIADTYAVEGFSPPVVADFENEYYRVGGSDSDFDSMLTYTSGDALSTMTDSDGLLKWCPHNLVLQSETFTNASWIKSGGSFSGDTFTANTSLSNHGLDQICFAFLGGVKYTCKARIEAGTHSAIAFRFLFSTGPSDYITCVADLSGESISDTNVGANCTLHSSSLTSNGDGSYTASFVISRATTATVPRFSVWAASSTNITPSNNGENLWTTTGTETFKIYEAEIYNSDLGGMVDNPDTGDSYVPTTTAAKYLARRGNHVYNGTSWVNKGLLLEPEARTNTLAYGNDFSTSWSISAAGSLTITANNSTGPDGNSSLHKIAVTDATSEAHILFDTVTTTSGVTHCFSAVFEDNDQQFVCLEIYDSTNRWVAAVFDVQNKTVTQESVGVNDSVLVGAGVIDLGGGVYRCWVSGTISNGDENGQARIMFVDSGTPTLTTAGVYSYAGTGGEYLNGGFTQFEVGPTPSSIIPTSGATVTRPAQALSIPAANMSYSATAMSFHVKGTFDWFDNNITTDTNSSAAGYQFWRWFNDGANYASLILDTGNYGGTGAVRFMHEKSSVSYNVSAPANSRTPAINDPFNLASRLTASELNLAQDGTALTKNSNLSGIATLSSNNFQLYAPAISSGNGIFGNITLFRQWNADITDTGIETAST